MKKIFDSLEGHWQWRRTISEQGTAQGKASFTRLSPTQLAYREDGLLSTQSTDFKMFRTYTYQLEEENISVFFAGHTNSLFHRLQFTSPITASASHLCLCDHYEATYTFLNPTTFRLTYQVKGPKKDYTIDTTFEKL